MNLNEWFEQGMTIEAYTESLDKHRDGFKHIYKHFTLPEDDDIFLAALQAKELRVIVLAEPWCSHCMLNIPILMRLTERVNMPLRLVSRDEDDTLMNQYLTNGKQMIPILIFIDQAGHEVAQWGPVAETTRNFMAKHRSQLPAETDPHYEDRFADMVQTVAQTFREDPGIWNGSYESLKEALID